MRLPSSLSPRRLGPVMQRLRQDRRGVTALEYGLIAALIAVAIIVSVRLLGTNIAAKFNDVATAIGGS
ncbi:Flp family type IVb pilin [Roseomonas sp. 18066]|uniref:Flp family type IVb pilin n=1 Tax=Roseomonas sp. 18066 TaxID=2681412 RepID=UPI001F205B75|nr:Flp family type IVb pilin [Roseomonas sp. 18066]